MCDGYPKTKTNTNTFLAHLSNTRNTINVNSIGKFLKARYSPLSKSFPAFFNHWHCVMNWG